MSTTTIYSRPGCIQCRATTREFDKHQLPYTLIDISTDDEARQYLTSLGFTAVPAVIAGTRRWAGHRPDRILALTQKARPG